MASETTPETHAALAAIGVAGGIATGLASLPPAHLVKMGAGGPAYNAAYAMTNAYRAHATVASTLGAGLTAAVGGPAVVATAVAAAPFVIGAVAIGAVAMGIGWAFGAFDEKK